MRELARARRSKLQVPQVRKDDQLAITTRSFFPENNMIAMTKHNASLRYFKEHRKQ